MVSVIVPSYKDKYLNKTIQSLLDNAGGEIEVVPVIDGYKLKRPLPDDDRVKPVILEDNVGMREAINIGVRESSGEYLMRSDEHCMFGTHYDNIMTTDICDNWIVTPRRYKLNVEDWKVEGVPSGYEKLYIQNWELGQKFGSRPWKSRDKYRQHYPVDETMAMQGSCWLMSRKHWDTVIKELDPAYGTLYQDSVEMTFKTWQAGGRLMLNKNTWYAHKHRRFKRTHQYPHTLAKVTFEYSLSQWEDYYEEVIKPRWGV